MFRTVILGAVLACITLAANGHEFWIDAETYQVAPEEPIAAHLRVGQEYEGPSNGYLPRSFRRFDILQGGMRAPVLGRLGDRPALNQAADEGLAVVLHVTETQRITWSEFGKFEAFVRHKDAPWAVDRHRERGLPDDGFSEVYSRYAKALVAVGSGKGADRRHGLLTEIVALANPYTEDVSEGLPVQLYYDGAIRGDAQIEVFEKTAGGEVTIFTLRTDADGMAVIPVKPAHRYMLDAVVVRAPSAELAAERDAVWESLWANLTFAVPER